MLGNYAISHYLTDYLAEFAAGRNLTQEELRNEMHKKLMPISKQNSITDALECGALSLYAGYKLYKFGGSANKKTTFFLGSTAICGMLIVACSTKELIKNSFSRQM